MASSSLYRLPPYWYIHVLDLNTNVSRVEIGPKTYIRQDNEKITTLPERMIIIPPRHYAVIENPVVRDEQDGSIITDEHGQAKLIHGDFDIRLSPLEPFPLYPGETMKVPPTELPVVPANSALKLKAILDFEQNGVKRVAGDQWLFEGPGTYIPRKEVIIEDRVKAEIIKPNQALKLRARRETIDRTGKLRVTGEEWLITQIGAYVPDVHEEVVGLINAHVLTDKSALHVRALKTFKDRFGVVRKNGDEWLVKMENSETYIPDVYEEIVAEVKITTLSSRQHCVILNPIGTNGRPQLGKRKLVKGEASFFLYPCETLENNIQNNYILSEREGLILRAKEAYYDDLTKENREPGERWMIKGPKEYIPPVEVEVVAQRNVIPLDQNEGIYVRDTKTGKIRLVVGECYMLTQDEELWQKVLPPQVEELLTFRDPLQESSYMVLNISQSMFDPQAGGQQQEIKKKSPKRDPTRAVTFRVPHNAAVQIYDYKEKKARVIFGPDLVILNADEHFTLLSLSGGRPKRPNVIKSLCLFLGPDFATDIVTVETADHARLALQLSYNWHFELGDRSEATAEKLFSVPDFVGEMCKAAASRVRGQVAQVRFDEFHKNSARIIRAAVFGFDENRKVRGRFVFPQNNVVITGLDVQSVEPVDQRTRDSLQKSVQLAIEITTNSQEAASRQEAERLEQEAKGRLERQKITDASEAERARKQLLELQAASAAVESTGQAKAEAQSIAEAAKIEGEAQVEQSRLKAEASKIESESELERLKCIREDELNFIKAKNAIELSLSKRTADIETNKFHQMVDALGQNTIATMATAGSEFQIKMLQSLGLSSTLITDGNTPINLFQTAQGLIGRLT